MDFTFKYFLTFYLEVNLASPKMQLLEEISPQNKGYFNSEETGK